MRTKTKPLPPKPQPVSRFESEPRMNPDGGQLRLDQVSAFCEIHAANKEKGDASYSDLQPKARSVKLP